ncbi:MAG: CpaD family pilus assembly lipoprotein [Sphingobium sp.]
MTIHRLFLPLLAGMAFASPAAAHPDFRGVETPHQPVVMRTTLTFDVGRGLPAPDRQRLADWFESIGLGYGDRVAVTGGGSVTSDLVATLVSRHGLLLGDDAPADAGEPPVGTLRVTVSRATASVSGCPDWGDRAEADYASGLSPNHGCATMGTLAAMVADAEDLVRGRRANLDYSATTASRAIKVYRGDAAPVTMPMTSTAVGERP